MVPLVSKDDASNFLSIPDFLAEMGIDARDDADASAADQSEEESVGDLLAQPESESKQAEPAGAQPEGGESPSQGGQPNQGGIEYSERTSP